MLQSFENLSDEEQIEFINSHQRVPDDQIHCLTKELMELYLNRMWKRNLLVLESQYKPHEFSVLMKRAEAHEANFDSLHKLQCT